eukprot:jgi/Mesvir1/21734/Mv04144-RA.1
MSQPPAIVAQAALGRIQNSIKQVLSQRRPWAELVDRNAFQRPLSFAEASSRVKKNVSYFKVNYAICLATVATIVILLHPSSLFILLTLVGLWGYLFVVRQEPLIVGGRIITDRELLLGMSVGTFVIVFFLTSVGTVIASALGFGLTGILAHGAMRVPDDLFLDEDPNASGGFLSLFAGHTGGSV